ncbi:MAG: Cna B-type domain-containing protein [Clostridia bacterium]|nr:Cna B-type domain-containing protein [Clostridia bacterium]
MKRTLKIIMALSLALCLILPCLIITAQGDGRIVVTIKNEAQKTFSGISINLCQIAAADAEGSFVFTDNFTDAGFNLPQRTDTETAEEAEALYEYIAANKISYTTIKTGSNGKSVFASLEDGIYLVFGNSGESVTFDPYLVFMPMYEDGVFVYDVESTPKLMEDSGGGGGGSDYSVSVTKIWDDDSNSANLRPSSVVVTLYRDGIAYKRVWLRESNGWKYTFTNLPEGSEYTVKEEDVEPYTPSYSGDAETGYVITNTYRKEEPTDESSDAPTEKPTNPGDEPTEPKEEPTEVPTETEEYGHVTVTKQWDDNGKNRPTYVTVQLIENGEVVQTAVLSEENGWTYTFTNLPMTNTYTVKEIRPTGYSVSYSGNASVGIVVTNKKKSGGGGGSGETPTEPSTSGGGDPTESSTEPSTEGDSGGNESTEPSTEGGNESTEPSTEREGGGGNEHSSTESSTNHDGGDNDTSTDSPNEDDTGEEGTIPTPMPPERETEDPSEDVTWGEYTTTEPIIPQTGDNILMCYVLCIAGAVLVLTGLLLIITGREKR